MSEAFQDASVDKETLDEKIDSIFRELELAFQWKRPSILFAIYNSKNIRCSAQDALEQLVLKSGQEVIHYQIEYDSNLNLTQFVSEITRKQESVFYIDPLNSEGVNSQIKNLISMLNSCRGFLIDHLIRVVFWLTENEALNVAHQAPDFWASRHRVFDFIHYQVPVGNQPAGKVSAGLGKGEKRPMAPSYIHNADDVSGESALVFDLSGGDEPSISGINLLLMMGVSNWKEGNHEKACETLRAALAIAEKSGNLTHQAMCHKAIALAETDSGKVEDAIQSYKKVAALGSESASIWNNVGALCLQAGRLDEGQEAYNNALKLDPADPISWNGLGMVYAGAGQLEEAISSFRKAIKLNAGYITPWVKLADVLSRQGRFQDALYAYMRTVEMDNKNVHAWSEIGNLYFKAGSFEQAIDAYKKAIMLGVSSDAVAINLAHAYTHAGYYTEAIPLIQKVLENNGKDDEKAELWNMLGDVYRRVNEYEKAVAAYEMADKFSTTVEEVQEAPGNSNYPNLMIEREPVSGSEKNTSIPEKEPLAVDQFQDKTPVQIVIPEHTPDVEISQKPVVSPENKQPCTNENANLWTRLGNTYKKAGAIDRAIEAYRKAVNLDPACEQGYDHLAEAFIQKSDLAEAVSVYRNRLEQLSSDSEKAITCSRIGDLSRQMRDYVGALEAFETAISLDPENETFVAGLEKIQVDLDNLTSGKADIAPGMSASVVVNPVPLYSQLQAKVPPPVVATAVKMETSKTAEPDQAAPAININLNSAIVWNELGNIFTRSRTFDEAVNAYKKANELNPEFGWSYSNLALVYARQGKRDEAVSLYQKSIGLLWTDADKAVAWNRLGDVYRQDGKYTEAIEAYQNADRLSHGMYVISATREVNFEQLFTYFVS